MNRFLLAASLVVALTACSRRTTPTNDPYPPADPRYPSPGETRYPSPYPSEDNSRTYPVEGQRDGVVTVIRTSDVNAENLPPGQAKKKYGSKSAKVYAPGQRKKNGGAGGKMVTVISVPDQYASRSTTGQLYYVYRGNTYWKQSDGYYHLAENVKTTSDDIKDDKQKDKKDKVKSKNKGKGKNKQKKEDDDD